MTINEFRTHLDATVNAITEDGYKDVYDVTITVNGKSVTLGLHADLYENLTRICDEENVL